MSGASAIHMQLLTVPPGARANAHKHEAHETAIYVLSGEVGMYYGEKLEHHMVLPEWAHSVRGVLEEGSELVGVYLLLRMLLLAFGRGRPRAVRGILGPCRQRP